MQLRSRENSDYSWRIFFLWYLFLSKGNDDHPTVKIHQADFGHLFEFLISVTQWIRMRTQYRLDVLWPWNLNDHAWGLFLKLLLRVTWVHLQVQGPPGQNPGSAPRLGMGTCFVQLGCCPVPHYGPNATRSHIIHCHLWTQARPRPTRPFALL